MNEAPNPTVKSRRRFLRLLGLSTTGVGVVGAAQLVKEKSNQGVAVTKAEIDKLKQDYQNLDRRTKMILMVVLMVSGLDLFLSL